MGRFNTVQFTLIIDGECWVTCYLYPTRRHFLLNVVTVMGTGRYLCCSWSVEANCCTVAAAGLRSEYYNSGQLIKDINIGTAHVLSPYGMPDKNTGKEPIGIWNISQL